MVNCWARTVVSFKWCDQAQVDKLDESVEWVWSIKTKTTGTWLSAIGWREDKLMGGGWGQPNDKWNKWLIPDFLGIWSKISNANLFVFLLNSVCWCKPSEESQRVLLEWGGSAREVKTGGKWDRAEEGEYGCCGPRGREKTERSVSPSRGFLYQSDRPPIFSRCLFLP